MDRRRGRGNETWFRLREWTNGQSSAERLSAQILRMEDYESIEPIHPLGGRDGRKDVVCERNGRTFVGAAYFPRGEHSYAEIRDKFLHDLQGVAQNKVNGIVFITNQELRFGERSELKALAGDVDVEIFHLERISSLLDSPRAYGIRLEYLDIEMSKEEQIALLSERESLLNEVKSNTELIISLIKDGNALNQEQKVSAVRVLQATRFLLEESNWNRNHYRGLIKDLHKSVDAAIPVLIDSRTFEEFIQKSGGSNPIKREFDDDWEPDWDIYFSFTKAIAFGRPSEDNRMRYAILRNHNIGLNQLALDVFREQHDALQSRLREEE